MAILEAKPKLGPLPRSFPCGDPVTIPFLVTEFVDVYDDSTADDQYGDPADAGTMTAQGIGVSLLERTDVTHNAQDSQEDTTRIYAGIAPPGTRIQTGYRLKSRADGAWYLVDHVKDTHGQFGLPIRIRLRRVDQ